MEKSISAITQAKGIVENANRYGQDKWVSWLPIVVDHPMYVAGSDWQNRLLASDWLLKAKYHSCLCSFVKAQWWLEMRPSCCKIG
jgi:hypothetical protein